MRASISEYVRALSRINPIAWRVVRPVQIDALANAGDYTRYLSVTDPGPAIIAVHAPLTALLRIRVELLYIRSAFLSKTATLFPCTKGVVGLIAS